MKGLFYAGMVFQILGGLWLSIPPFVIFGAIVLLLGIGSILYEFYHKEEFESKDTLLKIEKAKQKT